jgi:hypothetical protein
VHPYEKASIRQNREPTKSEHPRKMLPSTPGGGDGVRGRRYWVELIERRKVVSESERLRVLNSCWIAFTEGDSWG